MKVTLFHVGFPVYTMGLANALANHAEVTVVQPEALHLSCARIADSRLRLVTFPKPPFRRQVGNLGAIWRAFQLVRDSKPDILHLQEACDYAVDFLNMFMPLPPLVTTIHDVTPHPGDGHAAPGLQYSKAPSIWRARRVIVHTANMREQLASRFHIRSEKIDAIPHGELGSLYESLANRGGRKPLPREPFTMLFFGRIWPYKGLSYLLDAFARVKATLPSARLIIAGKGGDLDANARLIESLPDVQVLKSYIPDEDVAGLYQRSSVVVLPYIEASQSGVSSVGFTLGSVVVASQVGGLADSIQDGINGILVPPRNPQALAAALVRILQDTAKQEAIRQGAYILGRTKLDWTNIATSTMETYNKGLA